MANTRTKNNYGSNSKPKMKGKKIRIDGVNYRMVRRADGRYNLYVEGRAGAVGSTPLIDAKDYAEARKRIKEATKDFERIESESATNAANAEAVTIDEYENSTEDLVPASEYSDDLVVPQESSSEVDVLNDLDNDGVVDYRRASKGDVARARVTAATSNAALIGARVSHKSNSWLMKKGFDVMNKNLQEVANAKGMVGGAAKTVNKGVNMLKNQTTGTDRQYQTAFKREDETLRTMRLQEARKANAEAIRVAKEAGYKVLADEKARIEIEIKRAKEAGDGEALSHANLQLTAWSKRKAQFDKATPPNVKLPYPKLPKSNVTKGRTAVERRRLNNTLRGMDVDERLALRGRKAAKTAA